MKGCGLASAFRTLTILPLPGRESDSPATALYWFVPVGLFLAGILYGVAWIASSLGLELVGGVVLTGLLAILTRAFHLDGLADMVDGFGGGWTRDRVLEIMKDSHIGAFGVIALVLVLMLKAVAFTAIIENGTIFPLLYIPVLSRFLVVLQSVANPYARKEGGTAGRLVIESRPRHMFVSILWVIVVVMVSGQKYLMTLIIMTAVGLLVTVLLAIRARRRIGGVTGDILGATVELSECTMIVALAILLYSA
ncbi:adenosylcobinamide-GDP ribazoletransferase [Pleomorphochaeta sp. DL1XJH-081]|uniref:adenosylcobinamide-GDP ribazoletransferase n=1 Tax=Pleomorphochaeta sp. DL1XJH-081 TaxID=3409690 RepID=UPI003BB49B32